MGRPDASALTADGADMPTCTFEREQGDDRTLIRVAGTFDRGAAYELRDRLAKEPAGEVTLDFSLVSEFVDLGVATLAHVFAGAHHHRLVVRGLRQHQVRIFRYFGVDVEALRATSVETAGTPPTVHS